MGFRELRLSLLILICLISFASSSPNQKNLPSEFMQKIKLEDEVIDGSKIEGGSHHPSGARGQSNGENGGSRSPNTQGGSAVIPVVVGGAAANNLHHQNHHGAANCNLNRISVLTLLMITLVSLLIQLILLN
ncbi:hypothetical protein L6164_007112 [Bauhinia variegata]|uniref:Uncharacterized protein n=1 Tax=Bauhinia variegata TaxID=167791 RepID=A0ACB9PX24_BAUVA|nr:hypothetical protein L6164_007112 [Bauhinia variegata]